MNRKILLHQSTVTGMTLLAGVISLLAYVGVKCMQASLNTPLDDGDQRDLSFFVSLYYPLSIIAFIIAAPLLGLLITQIVQLLLGKNQSSSERS